MQYIIHFANLLYLFSYLVRDILWLRVITIFAILCLIPYFYSQSEPLYAAIAWNALFAVINIYQVYLLWKERQPVFLTFEEEKLRKLAFNNLSPREFKKLVLAGSWMDSEPGEVLIHQGLVCERLYVLSDGAARVEREGKFVAELQPGQFIGEMSYMTHHPTSTNVISISKTRLLAWTVDQLRDLFKETPTLQASIQLLIGIDLSKKLGKGSASKEATS